MSPDSCAGDDAPRLFLHLNGIALELGIRVAFRLRGRVHLASIPSQLLYGDIDTIKLLDLLDLLGLFLAWRRQPVTGEIGVVAIH